MTVYLGTFGVVELLRTQQEGTSTILDVTDATVVEDPINVLEGKFDGPTFFTGDQVFVTSTKAKEQLSFLKDSATDLELEAFVHVNEINNIKFYNKLSDAFIGDSEDAIKLQNPSKDFKIEIVNRSIDRRVLTQVTSFELNTQRETADTTALSEEFRSSVNTLISGSGRMSAFWEYVGEDEDKEMPVYLQELAIRTKLGSNFKANFVLKEPGYNPKNDPSRGNDLIFYDFEGLITACAVQFSTSNLIQIVADFVTTGPIALKMDLINPGAILKEDGFALLRDLAESDAPDAKLLTEFS